MTKKGQKQESRTETISLVVSPGVKSLLRKLAEDDARSVSFVAHRFLMESPSLRRLLSQQNAEARA
jgi:hypothetical protein